MFALPSVIYQHMFSDGHVLTTDPAAYNNITPGLRLPMNRRCDKVVQARTFDTQYSYTLLPFLFKLLLFS